LNDGNVLILKKGITKSFKKGDTTMYKQNTKLLMEADSRVKNENSTTIKVLEEVVVEKYRVAGNTTKYRYVFRYPVVEEEEDNRILDELISTITLHKFSEPLYITKGSSMEFKDHMMIEPVDYMMVTFLDAALILEDQTTLIKERISD